MNTKKERSRVRMNVELATLADYESVSKEGKINIMGVFQEINPPILPFALPQMYLVLVYNASSAEIGLTRETQIILMNADGNQLFTAKQSLVVPQPKRAGSKIIMNQIIGLAGYKFEEPGDYQFSVLVGDDEKCSIPLLVNEPPKKEGES